MDTIRQPRRAIVVSLLAVAAIVLGLYSYSNLIYVSFDQYPNGYSCDWSNGRVTTTSGVNTVAASMPTHIKVRFDKLNGFKAQMARTHTCAYRLTKFI